MIDRIRTWVPVVAGIVVILSIFTGVVIFAQNLWRNQSTQGARLDEIETKRLEPLEKNYNSLGTQLRDLEKAIARRIDAVEQRVTEILNRLRGSPPPPPQRPAQ